MASALKSLTGSIDMLSSLEELADKFKVSLDDLPLDQRHAAATKLGDAIAMDGIDPMHDWLGDNGHIVNDNGGDWVEVVCPWCGEHTTGDNTAGYSPLGRGSGVYVQTRAFKCLHEHCIDRKLPEFCEWAIKRGAPRVSGYDPLPWLQSRYAYIETGQQVADLTQRLLGGIWVWELTDWSKKHPGRVKLPGRDKPVAIATAFIEHPDTRKAVGTLYRPVAQQSDIGMVEAWSQPYVNTYVPPNWQETDETPVIFLEHMEYLIPDKAQREVFLSWVAFKIQNPDTRSYAIIMVAEDAYGTGRSWLKDMLAKALQGHVNMATLSQLIGKGTSAEKNYNDWMAGCQFLVVEEAKDTISRDDFYHGYETFKQMVDTRVAENVRINPKYGRTRTENVYFNALIFSNHADAMALPEGDRRVYVLENPTERLSYDYYDRLDAALRDDEPARVYWWLMHRDVSDFDHVYPPMTPGKLAMIEQNRSPSAAIKDHILEHCKGDIFTKKMLKSLVLAAADALDYDGIVRSPGGVNRNLWKKMGPLRDEKNGARYQINGVTIEVRAIRNVGKWKVKDAARA